MIFQLTSIENFLDNQVDLTLKADGDTYFNYFVMDVKSDGRHSKQVTKITNVYQTERNTELNTKLYNLKNLVQPYLLGFKLKSTHQGGTFQSRVLC